jgi:RimJ/RimL family protein N-acetyltransferase
MSVVNDLIRLRPIVEPDLAALERIYNDPVDASEFGFFGWVDQGQLRKRFEAGFLGPDGGRLAVVRAGDAGETLVGDVGWRRVLTAPNCATWNIGIGLFAKERGRGYGTGAQRLLVEYLFSHTQVYRVEATTESANIAEQRALEKAGFTREGVLRGACFRAGAWRDMVSYSVVRPDLALGGLDR